MSTLMMIVPGSGRFHPSTKDEAEEMYSDIVSKTGCSSIIALREDSNRMTPIGLQEYCDSIDVPVSTHTIERIDPSSFTGTEDPDTLWSDHMATIISQSGHLSFESDTNFVIGPGSGWNSSLLSSLQRITGGKIWGSILRDGRFEAVEVQAGLPTGDSLSTIAAAGELSLEWGEQRFQSEQLQGLVDGVPANAGIENTFRPYPNLVSRHQEGEFVEFELTPEGKVTAILSLAKKWSPPKIRSGMRGLILAVRNHEEARTTLEFIEFMKEHWPALDFDRFCVLVNEFDSDGAALVTPQETNDHIVELLGDRLIQAPEKSPETRKDRDFTRSQYELLSLIHRIRKSNDDVEWSIEISRFLSPLRSSIALYSYHAGLETFCLMKNRLTPEPGISPSGLRAGMHRLSLPSRDQLLRVRDILDTKSIEKHVFTAAKAFSDPQNPGTILSGEKDHPLLLFEWNRNNIPKGSPMRWPDGVTPQNQRKKMSDGRSLGIKQGAFVDSPIRQFELTPEGLVSGFLIGASMEGGK